jgi:putative transposase
VAAHKIYPCLLGGISIERVDQVCCADVTGIPMVKGSPYLVIMDWASRAVLAWRLSNALGTGSCVEAFKEALSRYDPLEIFNPDPGRLFTKDENRPAIRARLHPGTGRRLSSMVSMAETRAIPP